MRLYVGNLSYETAEQDLQSLFTPLGSVESVRLIRDQFSGRSRGFGFVEMLNEQEGRNACATLDQKDFQGRRLTVNEAKPQEQRGGFASRGTGGRTQREPRW